MVFGLKNDRSLLCCVNHQNLNAMTIKDAYTISLMNEWLNSLGKARIRAANNGNSGYLRTVIQYQDGKNQFYVIWQSGKVYEKRKW